MDWSQKEENGAAELWGNTIGKGGSFKDAMRAVMTRAVELLAERVLPDDALKRAWEVDTYADVKALVATLQAKVEELERAGSDARSERDAAREDLTAARAEVERTKAKLDDAERARNRAMIDRSNAESRLAAITEALDAIRDGRRFRGEHTPESIARVALGLEGDAPNSPGIQDGSGDAPQEAKALPRDMPPHAFVPRSDDVKACGHDLGLTLCGYSERHHRFPCSPACTHDDAANPGHPERVKAQSVAVARAALGMPETERSEAFEQLVWSKERSADWRLGFEDGKERGAEDMRAACWEAIQPKLDALGVDASTRELFKSAIEGAAP